MLDLSYADPRQLKKEGRSFDCSRCPEATQRIRKCKESREDFTTEDGPQFPIYIRKGGRPYGFCPAKATWDQHIVGIYRILILCSEMQQFPNGECLEKQDPDLIEVFSWFLPRYNQYKFAQNASMILGGDDSKGSTKHGDNSRAFGKGRTRL